MGVTGIAKFGSADAEQEGFEIGEIATIIDNIGLLWTMDAGLDVQGPRCGRDAMREVGTVEDAAIAIDVSGRIAYAGPKCGIGDYIEADTHIVDAEGAFVCPGFVDPHTHLVHGGSREQELPLRIAGASYLDILKAGGGIHRTVRETRERPQVELFEQAAVSLLRLQSFGVTTVEAKTGYGLNLETELKQLQVARQLDTAFPVSLALTALPAHALPPEFQDTRDQFVDHVIELLPHLKDAGAQFADVFVEDGVFTVDEGREILLAAKRMGMDCKLHADEMIPFGGAELAAEVGAVSADHLLAASDDGLHRMAEANVIAVCLPGTSFYLQKPPARARFMMDEANLAVAIASDYNPGSSPSENFGLTMTLGLLALRLTPQEVFTAATINAAHAIRREDVAGIIRPGRPADVVLFNAKNPEYVLTHYGVSHVRAVFKAGQQVV